MGIDKNEYLRFVLDFASTVKKASFYSPTHPIVISSIENVFLKLQSLLQHCFKCPKLYFPILVLYSIYKKRLQ